MSLSINNINAVSFKSKENSIVNPKRTVVSPKSEEGLSREGKVFIGFCAAVRGVIGGIFVKRRIDANEAEKLSKKAAGLLLKPKEFSYNDLRSYANELLNAKRISDDDRVLLVGKSILNEFAENVKNFKNSWGKLFKAMNMSNNGFAVCVQKADKHIDMSTFKYFDPECITEPKIVESIKEGKIMIIHLKN